MKLWQQLKSKSQIIWSELLEASPGFRFRHHYQRQQYRASEHPLIRPLKLVVALLLLTLGFMLGFLPFLPGSVFGLLGFALLASQFRFVAFLLDRLELFVRRMIRKLGWSQK